MIVYFNRKSGKKEIERVYKEKWLHFFYHPNPFCRALTYVLAHFPLFSKFYGMIQRWPITKSKIAPFIEKYHVDESEFVKRKEEFTSFDDFFTRELKKEARPIHEDDNVVVAPADGRYLCIQNIEKAQGFVVKGKKFSLKTLLCNQDLAKHYAQGSMVLIRLCPSDYHRFHFPLDCLASSPRLINGPLYSVNPIAIKQNIDYLAQNKRMLTELTSKQFGKIIFIEVGATCVGSIHQTFNSNNYYKKGDEKGFFSFGGSSIILLFEQNRIQFDTDLIKNSSEHTETLCLTGQSLGQCN